MNVYGFLVLQSQMPEGNDFWFQLQWYMVRRGRSAAVLVAIFAEPQQTQKCRHAGSGERNGIALVTFFTKLQEK